MFPLTGITGVPIFRTECKGSSLVDVENRHKTNDTYRLMAHGVSTQWDGSRQTRHDIYRDVKVDFQLKFKISPNK